MSATPPDPGLWPTLKARQVVVVDSEVPEVDREVLRNCVASHQVLELDRSFIQPLLSMGDTKLVSHSLRQLSHLHLKVSRVVN